MFQIVELWATGAFSSAMAFGAGLIAQFGLERGQLVFDAGLRDQGVVKREIGFG